MLLIPTRVLDVPRNSGPQGTRSIVSEPTAVASRLPEHELV